MSINSTSYKTNQNNISIKLIKKVNHNRKRKQLNPATGPVPNHLFHLIAINKSSNKKKKFKLKMLASPTNRSSRDSGGGGGGGLGLGQGLGLNTSSSITKALPKFNFNNKNHNKSSYHHQPRKFRNQQSNNSNPHFNRFLKNKNFSSSRNQQPQHQHQPMSNNQPNNQMIQPQYQQQQQQQLPTPFYFNSNNLNLNSQSYQFSHTNTNNSSQTMHMPNPFSFLPSQQQQQFINNAAKISSALVQLIRSELTVNLTKEEPRLVIYNNSNNNNNQPPKQQQQQKPQQSYPMINRQQSLTGQHYHNNKQQFHGHFNASNQMQQQQQHHQKFVPKFKYFKFGTAVHTKNSAPYNTTQYIMHDYTCRKPNLKKQETVAAAAPNIELNSGLNIQTLNPDSIKQFNNDWNKALAAAQSSDTSSFNFKSPIHLLSSSTSNISHQSSMEGNSEINNNSNSHLIENDVDLVENDDDQVDVFSSSCEAGLIPIGCGILASANASCNTSVNKSKSIDIINVKNKAQDKLDDENEDMLSSSF